mgnify:CR=1 FL=1
MFRKITGRRYGTGSSRKLRGTGEDFRESDCGTFCWTKRSTGESDWTEEVRTTKHIDAGALCTNPDFIHTIIVKKHQEFL